MKQHAVRRQNPRSHKRRVFAVVVLLLAILVVAVTLVRHSYFDNLRPVSSSTSVTLFTIQSGESSSDVGDALMKAGLIRSSSVFEWYISSKNVRADLQAGTYALRPNMGVSDIVKLFVNGTVAANLVTILPGQRIDQIQRALIKDGFRTRDVAAALTASTYAGNSALADNPAGASLEGFLYPDSFQKTTTTKPQVIVQESLNEMSQHLTPSIRAAFTKEGLNVYQGVTLASIVEQEVPSGSDRAQAAQVFLSRLKLGIPLGSDVTAYYGAIIAGKPISTRYNSPYNTLLHKGLPPGPISNVDDSALNAVAHPAKTSWLYFVSGDNGKTYFSKTLAEQQANTAQYCHRLCSGAN